MIIHNTTHLDTQQLESMLMRHAEGWPHEKVKVAIRYSRTTDFSGSCYYATGRLYVNIGRHLRYPYRIPAKVAKARKYGHFWYRPALFVVADEPELVVLYVFLHEFYHWLVSQAGRDIRRKEAMCDRFATRALVDTYGCAVQNEQGREVARYLWDWQDLDGFVRAASRQVAAVAGPARRTRARRPIAPAKPKATRARRPAATPTRRPPAVPRRGPARRSTRATKAARKPTRQPTSCRTRRRA